MTQAENTTGPAEAPGPAALRCRSARPRVMSFPVPWTARKTGSFCERGHPARRCPPGGPGARGPWGSGMRLLGAAVPGSALTPERGPHSRTPPTSPSSGTHSSVPRPAAHRPPSPRQTGETWTLATQVYCLKNKCYGGHRKSHFKNSECVSLCEASLSPSVSIQNREQFVSLSAKRQSLTARSAEGVLRAVPHRAGSFPAPLSSPDRSPALFPSRGQRRQGPEVGPWHPAVRAHPPPPQVSCWRLPLSTAPAWPSRLGTRHWEQGRVGGNSPGTQGRPCWYLPSPRSSKCRTRGMEEAPFLMEMSPGKSQEHLE